MSLLKKLQDLFVAEDRQDLEGRATTVLAIGKCDLRFSCLPPLPSNGMYFKEGETIRYWVDVESEGNTERYYFKKPAGVDVGQKVVISYDSDKGMMIIPNREKQ